MDNVIVRVPPLRVYGEYTGGSYDNFQGKAQEVMVRTVFLHKHFVVVLQLSCIPGSHKLCILGNMSLTSGC